MTSKRNRFFIASQIAAAALLVSTSAAATAEGTSAARNPVPEAQEEQVQDELTRHLAERRQAMLAEAGSALEETNAALAALGKDDRESAIAALARATGKLELLVARDPGLALAPVDVKVVTHDLYATPASIRAARDQAEAMLAKGRLQDARALLGGLGSEVIIEVWNLPLASYPEAIKAVSPLIDAGKSEEAKAALRSALDTLVVTRKVVSLPVLRAGFLLDRAEQLVSNPETTDEKAESGDRADEVAQLLSAARDQIELAEVLGYGKKSDYEDFREQIVELEKAIGRHEESSGTFARLRRMLDSFQTSFTE